MEAKMGYLTFALVLLALWAGLTLLVRRSVRQRPKARRYREIFIALANDLVAKAEFPDKHAEQLVSLARMRPGWLSRYMAYMLIRNAAFGYQPPRSGSLRLEQIPAQLRGAYLRAIVAFILSDSYRSALLGRVVRTIYSWLPDAVEDIKPDINAHATRRMAEQVQTVRKPEFSLGERELVAC